MEKLKANLARRPWWMNVLMLFCGYMTFVYVPWDMLFKPVAEAEEVWFGIVLTGWAARVSEPLHWLIYGAGTWGFWKMKGWMHPWASVYTMQVAVSMLIWNVVADNGQGWVAGLLMALPFVVLAVLLWQAKSLWIMAAASAPGEQ